MTYDELPPEEQWYEVQLGDGTFFSINGISKQNLLVSRTDLVELPDREVINKKFIRFIRKDINKTKSLLQKTKKLHDSN